MYSNVKDLKGRKYININWKSVIYTYNAYILKQSS